MMPNWKEVVGAVAPGIATALGGPLAGAAVAALSSKLLGKDDGTEDEVAAAVAGGNPDVLLKIKQAERDFTVKMRELDIDVTKLALGDRADARKSNVAAGIQGKVFALVLVILIAVLGIEGCVLFVGVPKTVDGQIVGRILGTLDALLLAAVYYVFGSSAGSDAKTGLLTAK